MKGLLLKDFYTAKKYCRAYLLIVVVFTAVSISGIANSFMMFYPAVICGILPTTLIAYDERSRWNVYEAALPCSKAQVVSVKYIDALFATLAVMLLSCAALTVRLISIGEFTLEAVAARGLTLMAFGMICPAVNLPFIFKYGSEKGRIAYYIVLVLSCIAAFTIPVIGVDIDIKLSTAALSVLTAVIVCAIFVGSWFISVQIYKKREL